jgi:hypothetical protein
LDQDAKWRELVRGTPQDDIHFMPEYLSYFEGHMGAECRMFVFGDEDEYILFPIFIRKIGEGPQKDAVSPWYYGGPLVRGEPDGAAQDRFMREFTEYLRSEDIVSLFARSNPYRGNADLLGDRMSSYDQSKVVYVDLCRPEEDIWKRSFDNNARRNIRREEDLKCEVFEDSSGKYIREFHYHYIKEMERKGAPAFYKFPLEFIEGMFESLDGHIVLTNKVVDGEWAAGSIEIVYKEMGYGFLATRVESCTHVGSHYLMEWNIIRILKGKGVCRYDLGGGKKGSGLLRHKESLSRDSFELISRRLIVDRTTYSDLCRKEGMADSEIRMEGAPYFPEYRIKY